MARHSGFVPSIPAGHAQVHHVWAHNQSALSSSFSNKSLRCSRHRRCIRTTTTHTAAKTTTTISSVLQNAHTMAELVNQLMVSCGVGLAGIVGGKATEQVREMIGGDRRAEAMDRIASEIDSFRRRRELATIADVESERDWTDVSVDKLANVVVVQDDIPTLGRASDELIKFDSLLATYDNNNNSASHVNEIKEIEQQNVTDVNLPDDSRIEEEIENDTLKRLTKPTEFVMDEDYVS